MPRSFAAEPAPLYAHVALPLPLFRTFTYRVPDAERARARVGSRVLVPFRRTEQIGWIERLGTEADVARVRPLRAVLDREPVVSQELLGLCRWIAEYYVAPLGVVIRTSLPGALSDTSTDVIRLASPPAEAAELSPLEDRLVSWLRDAGEPRPVSRLRRDLGRHAWWPVIHRLESVGLIELQTLPPRTEAPVRTRRVVRLTADLPSLRQRDQLFARAPRQREAWQVLESMDGVAELQHLTGRLGFSRSVVSGLEQKGLVTVADEEILRDPYAEIAAPPDPGLSPTPAQAEVIRRLVEASRTEDPGAHLLRGVTGSGKTLVYIELLREVVVRQGRSAIVLVPEIALTPQTVGRFRAAFGERVAVLHSALSDGERFDEWRALRRGEKRIVVGARSAIFAPLEDLGAIVVDEEHESSYKQADAPRYHAREVAVVRAKASGAVCVLGSATPSLESWTNALAGKYRSLELPARVRGQPLPPIRVIDLRQERKRLKEHRGGDRDPAAGVLSEELRNGIAQRLARREQSILLLNRRGYSSFVQCRECGHVWHCPQCNVSLTFHRGRARITCHYCLHEEPTPDLCSACGSRDLAFRGLGTEQVERIVQDAFPAAVIARMDVDTTSGRWSHHRILERVGTGEVDILLGTQMIAKGLDFPNVTLVGVVNADTGINLPDFRASERTFQLLTQVAGRAGRGEGAGEVIIQTSLPTHYVVACAIDHDYVGFAERELETRIDPPYPPHTRLVNIVVSGLEEEATQEGAELSVRWIRGLLKKHGVHGVEIVGPAPCAIDRIRGRWRWHLLLRSDSPTLLGKVARAYAARFQLAGGTSDLRAAVDRDPVNLL